jgi:UDP-N-acetylmuramate--alanine ligase
MHIYFSGIGGTGIGPLALIAHQAGYTVSGSDKQDSNYIDYLKKHGVSDIHIGQTHDAIEAVHTKNPIDWIVRSSAVAIENPNHPELLFAKQHSVKSTKRDELLNHIIFDKQLKLIAIAGTHGKTTTTAMAIWLAKQLGLPVSYSVGAKSSFADMGHFDSKSEYFIYEADEFDRNFLSFTPYISIISGVGYDHPDIYPTKEIYNAAFRDFIDQSRQTFIWENDAEYLSLDVADYITVLEQNSLLLNDIYLPGLVNRQDAAIVANAFSAVCGKTPQELLSLIDTFPGLSRRFEKIRPGLYTDYAHTPEKIRGAIDTALEVNKNVVVVYEGLHNTRQHFIKKQLEDLFAGVKTLYVVPSYRAREDETLEDLTPEKLTDIIKTPQERIAINALDDLTALIQEHLANGDLVLCLSAGGGNSLDEWLRKE